jgi:hypothetical protein
MFEYDPTFVDTVNTVPSTSQLHTKKLGNLALDLALQKGEITEAQYNAEIVKLIQKS